MGTVDRKYPEMSTNDNSCDDLLTGRESAVSVITTAASDQHPKYKAPPPPPRQRRTSSSSSNIKVFILALMIARLKSLCPTLNVEHAIRMLYVLGIFSTV